MRTRSLLALALAGLLSGACSTDPADALPQTDGGTGALVMRIEATRTPEDSGSAAYDPMDHLKVRIYNADGGLIRKYDSREELPSRLELLAGRYSVRVEAGESEKSGTRGFASFEKRLYRGEKEFSVRAGATEQVEVLCRNVNSAVEVKFAPSLAANLDEGFGVWVAAAERFDESAAAAGEVPALHYTTDACGYFDLTEEETSLVWHFSGQHPERGAVVKTGTLSGILQPGRYTLEFAWSDDLPGFIECFVLKVDTSTDNRDDTIVFSPDPTIESDGFDMDGIQDYESGERRIRITTVKPMETALLTVDGTEEYDLLAAAGDPALRALRAEAPAGLGVLQESETALTVTLAEPFFAVLAGGDHTLAFSVSDTAGGSAARSARFRLQGLEPVAAGDCDLWQGSVTLRFRQFASSTLPVKLALRTEGGTWQEQDAARDAEGRCTAVFAPRWTEAVDPQRPAEESRKLYRPAEGTGIFAGRTYECRAQAGGNIYTATFTAPAAPAAQAIPDGDMENASLSCFTLNNQRTDFWGSGNNKTMGIDISSLCTQQSYGGSQCAALASTYAGMAGINMLAAGNLFSGTFVKESTTKGVVSFGKRLEWTARPTAIRFRCHASIGPVDCTKHKLDGADPIPSGAMDKGRVFAAIVDWDTPRQVSSGTSAPTGVWDPATWDPANHSDQTQGAIIGYASWWIEASTDESETDATGMTTVTLPFYFYDTETRPTKSYTVVISASANAYGDFMNGCRNNRIYIDDFEWVY